MTRLPPHRHSLSTSLQGFTLLEILIVLVIISIAAGLVQWNIGSRKEISALRQEAGDLRELLLFAADYGLIHQQALGLMASDEDYELMAFSETDRHWHSFGDHKRTIDSNIRLLVENQTAMPDVPAVDGIRLPAVLIDADGSLSPCRIAFQWRDNPALQVTLVVENGNIHIDSGAEANHGAP